jgi:hypothetical protein
MIGDKIYSLLKRAENCGFKDSVEFAARMRIRAGRTGDRMAYSRC